MKLQPFNGMAILFLAIVTPLVGTWWRSPEPRSQDQPLSYWLAELNSANRARPQEATNALREIGAVGIPFLLRQARKEHSGFKRFYREAWFRLPQSIQSYLRPPETEDAALDRISHALHQLGPAAGPTLMNALDDPNPAVRFVAGASFPYGYDSPLGVRWEIKLLQTADYDLKQHAAGALGILGPHARPAVPALLAVAQHDATDYVRETAARPFSGDAWVRCHLCRPRTEALPYGPVPCRATLVGDCLMAHNPASRGSSHPDLGSA